MREGDRCAPHPNSMAARKTIRIPSFRGSPFTNTGFPDDWGARQELSEIVGLFTGVAGARHRNTETAVYREDAAA